MKRYITTNRKSPLSTLPLSTSKPEIQSFLGLAGYLCLWTPNFILLAQPLYQATRGALSDPLKLKSNIRSAFNSLKQAILSAPALTLPDISRSFILYTTERQNCPKSFETKSGPLFHPCRLPVKALVYHNSRMATLPTCSGSSCTPRSEKQKAHFRSTHCHSFTTWL